MTWCDTLAVWPWLAPNSARLAQKLCRDADRWNNYGTTLDSKVQMTVATLQTAVKERFSTTAQTWGLGSLRKVIVKNVAWLVTSVTPSHDSAMLCCHFLLQFTEQRTLKSVEILRCWHTKFVDVENAVGNLLSAPTVAQMIISFNREVFLFELIISHLKPQFRLFRSVLKRFTSFWPP